MGSRRDFVTSAIALAASAQAMTAKGESDLSGLESTWCADYTALPAKKDYRDRPFRVAVAFGESITAGGEATSPELDWVSLLADLINEAQFEPVKMYNNGIGANMISPRSTRYEASTKPSAMERYNDHVIDYHPDLVVVNYGVNDACGGTPLSQFIEDERHIVQDIQKQTGALVVVDNLSYMTDFDRNGPAHANVATFVGFNQALQEMAEECDALYGDIFAAQDMAAWTVDPEDEVHLNNLGHRLIANRMFEVLAQNCSCLSQKARALRKAMVKEWRPTRELELQEKFLREHKQENLEKHP